jgi:hypothetical protein
LIDLHGHRGYNICTLWNVPELYANRNEWDSEASYSSNVKQPAYAISQHPPTARAMVRYVEAKAIMQGTCAGQGTFIRGLNTNDMRLRGAMRNVEETNDPRLPEAGSMVPDLAINSQQKRADFEASLANRQAYFYHLSEGVDAQTRERFIELETHDLLSSSLVGIHGLALEEQDYVRLKSAGAKIVWSPYSNYLLYGETLSLAQVLASGVPISLGCDWSPTGSKGLLEELKVARITADEQNAPLTDEDLVRMVTTTPAYTLGWDHLVGSIQPNRLADIVAIDGIQGNPYTQLIQAREPDVQLVAIHGIGRYGNQEILSQTIPSIRPPDASVESCEVAGVSKAFYLYSGNSVINDVSVGAARKVLTDALADLYHFKEQEAVAGLAPMDAADAFIVVLDEMSPDSEAANDDAPGIVPLAPPMAESILLDSMFVDEQHIDAIRAQRNVPPSITANLLASYGVA